MPPTRRPGPRQRRLLPDQRSEFCVISRDGGPAEVIWEAGDLFEAPNWTPDGVALVFNADGRLWRISPDGTDGPTRIDIRPTTT